MKKFIYIIIFTFAVAASLTACTEETVAPKTNTGNYSGGGIDPKG